MRLLATFYRSSVGKKMIVAITGIILILFVIGHLLGNLQIFIGPDWINGYSEHLRDLGPLGHYDVYLMMVYGFQNYFVSAFYVLGLFLLALHLSHGSSSFFQSLGLNDKKLTPRLALGGRIFAWLLFAGYTSIPVAVLLGLVRPAQQL